MSQYWLRRCAEALPDAPTIGPAHIRVAQGLRELGSFNGVSIGELDGRGHGLRQLWNALETKPNYPNASTWPAKLVGGGWRDLYNAIVGSIDSANTISYSLPNDMTVVDAGITATRLDTALWNFQSAVYGAVKADIDMPECLIKITYNVTGVGTAEIVQFQESQLAAAYDYTSPYAYAQRFNGKPAFEYQSSTTPYDFQMADVVSGTMWMHKTGDTIEVRYGGTRWSDATRVGVVANGMMTADRLFVSSDSGDNFNIEFLPLP